MTTNKLFTEIFRPKDLNHILIPDRIRKELSKGLVQNILFYGPAGCGKTSLSRIILTENSNVSSLTINASEARGIDVVREQIISFASTLSLEEGAESSKIILLEECDGLTSDSWSALRAVIEKYANNVRFIANCNYVDKIPEPIQSRFNMIPVYPINKAEEEQMFELYCKYTAQILDYLKIKYNDETLKCFIKIDFPDMRSIINKVQSLYIQQVTELNKENLIKSFDCSSLFDMIFGSGDIVKNYQLIMRDYASNPEDVILEFSKNFVDFLRTNYPNKISKIPYCIIAIAEHAQMVTQSIDKVITLLSLVFKLQQIINSFEKV
jgi:replication-associated recombination protein RarA